MIQPWFDPNHYAWIPGTVYGCIAGILGGLVGWLVPRGRAKRFILSTWITLWAAGVAMLAVGVMALLSKQPWGVWYAFLLPGVVGTIVIGANLLVILKRYRQVEQRRLSATDLF